MGVNNGDTKLDDVDHVRTIEFEEAPKKAKKESGSDWLARLKPV